MTRSFVCFTNEADSEKAGIELGNRIKDQADGKGVDVAILFASSTFEYSSLLKALKRSGQPEILIGCSSAGEFTSSEFSTDSACVVAIQSTDIQFSASLGKGISRGREEVVKQLTASLLGKDELKYGFHSGLVLADALSGYTDEIIDLLTESTAGLYQFFGGGAGDNANFSKTHVFFGEEAHSDAVVLLEILSSKRLGLGVSHGWQPVGEKMRVTAADGLRLISINARPAVEIFEEYAESTGQHFDPQDPVPFFLHNVLGIVLDDSFKLRVPLSVQPDGSVICASNISTGALISFMSIEPDAASTAAMLATQKALQQLGGNKPSVALFFDCVATRLRMGKAFNMELEQVKNVLSGTSYAGCNTYGQVARLDGQFSGFHNCTAVVCVIPE